ncbi:hypothetical protein BASA50_000727 [Batrachochytrium salamandrivorans]|uniref:Uncharacterized protein n=1 Tax=Batrachochytrium salamandrivorans TaxID=1357716 RepID=A0ABQ8ETK3_9FUNG|nr:hypothetical protein BASA50_000727 [Batrachochytrium salamandrivorans]KAH9265565.1 hypothetical protein BASA84_001569 [Batrachochytrium salamandrivorans]
MKLSGVFVAAMVITSVNAGWFDDLFGDIKIRPIRLSVTSPSATPELSPSPSATPELTLSPSPTPNSQPTLLQKQKKAHPLLSHLFTKDEEHNGFLIALLGVQTNFFSLLIKAKNEASYYFDNTGLAEMLAEDSLGEVLGEYSDRYQKADDTVGEIYICFRKFENAMLEYLKQYNHLPETSPILTVKDLKLNIQLLRKELKSTARVSA